MSFLSNYAKQLKKLTKYYQLDRKIINDET